MVYPAVSDFVRLFSTVSSWAGMAQVVVVGVVIHSLTRRCRLFVVMSVVCTGSH